MTEERDPHGRDPHSPGAKLDDGKPRVGLMLRDFARALTAVAEVTTAGADKYTPSGWRHVPNGVERYEDALGRHQLAVERRDPDTNLLHAAHRAWNSLAVLELMLMLEEEEGGQP